MTYIRSQLKFMRFVLLCNEKLNLLIKTKKEFKIWPNNDYSLAYIFFILSKINNNQCTYPCL